MELSRERKDYWESIMSCLSMTVGLGNLWRFPFVAYENGGGAFVLSYIIILFLLGIPLYFLELALGQFSSKGSLKMFHSLAPAFTGVGALQLFATLWVSPYYSSLLAVVLYYIIKSFAERLPWSVCYSDYGNNCFSSASLRISGNLTSSTELFFIKNIFKWPLDLHKGIGKPNWRLALGLGFTWFGTSFVLIKKVYSSGRTQYIFGLYPYFMLFIILGVALSQNGSNNGIRYLFNINWNSLISPRIWYNAIGHCFYSLGVGFGSIVLFGSSSPFQNDINFISKFVPITVACASLVNGVTIFSTLGSMAQNMNSTVESVIKSGGFGLFFITYPEALTMINTAPYVMSILCFIMVYALGFSSLLAFQQVIIRQIVDYTDLKFRNAAVITSVIGFTLGIIYITPGGMILVELVDFYGVSMILYIGAFAEIVCVLRYSLHNFCFDVKFMTMKDVSTWYRFVWGLIAPFVLIVVYIWYIISIAKKVYDTIHFSTLATVFGWLLVACGVALVPGFAIYNLYSRREEEWPEVFWDTFSHREWMPLRSFHQSAWLNLREMQQLRRNGVKDALFSYVRTLMGR